MEKIVKEAFKDSVKYPWHTVFLTENGTAGKTFCVKNSMGTKLFSVTKAAHFDRAKRRVLSDYSLTVYTNPTETYTGEAEKVDVEGIFHSCETKFEELKQLVSDTNFMGNSVVKFLRENQK